MRQSRHLLVTNLPDHVTELEILAVFQKFGKVQSVRFLNPGPSSKSKSGCNSSDPSTTNSSSSTCESGVRATVAFIDIRSAAKALNNPDNKIDEYVLKTSFYEPPASSTSSSAIFIHETREDALLVQRQSSSSSSTSSNTGYNSQVTTSTSSLQQLTSSTSSTLASYSTNTTTSTTTTTNNNNNSSNNTSYASPNNGSNSQVTTPTSNVSSSSLFLQTSHGSNVDATSVPGVANAISNATASSARSASSTSSSSQRLHHLTSSRSSCSKEIPAAVVGSNSQIHQASSHTIGGNGSNPESSSILDRDYDHHKSFSTSHSICVRNLPVRSSDTSLKDGLYHEYKKHGKVTLVKVVGSGPERFAIVYFKKAEDVEKALEVSKDKLFFGCKIEVTAQERPSRRPLWNSTDSEPRNPSCLSHSSPGKSRSQIQSMSPPPPGLRHEKDCKRIMRTPRSPASSRSSSVGGDIPEPDLNCRKSSLEDTTDFQKENQKRFSSGSLSNEAINDSNDTHKRKLENDTDSSSDERHEERKKRLLACIEPKNNTGKDRAATSSSRTSFEGARITKPSQSMEPSGDDLAEEVLEIVKNRQINLKDVTDKTLLTILERLSAENVDASRSSSDSSDIRTSRIQGERSKKSSEKSSYPRVNLNEDRVNPSLTDPRRPPSCVAWVTNSLSPPHLLNSSCRDHPSIKRQQNISEPSVDSTGMSSPKDVSSTSLKSECDDLVSSSSDKPPARTPMSLPLPEFAVLMLGAPTFTSNSTSSSLLISSKAIDHLIPGSVQTVISPALVIHGHPSLATSPKNISITSPLNTFSPLPGKRLRESTDSKGSEVSTSDRDSLEAASEAFVIKQEHGIGFEKCPSPTKGSTGVISGDSIEDRIRALDKKFTAWSSSTTTVVAPAATVSSCPVPIGAGAMKQQELTPPPPPTPTIDYSKYHIKKKSQANASTSGDGCSRNEPSEIGKFFMSKTSIFDQDSKRLEHINEKYEPKDSSLVETTSPATPVQRTVIRTKAEAKEFAPPTDRTPSSSKGPNVHPNHTHPSPLGSLQRKLSEPSKMPPSSTTCNVKREPVGPSTPQSAPARPGSSAPFGHFPSGILSPSEAVGGKNSTIPIKKEGVEKITRDPRRELHQTDSKAGLFVNKELPVNPAPSIKKDTLHGKDSLKGSGLKQMATSSTTSSSNSSGTGRGPPNVPSHAKIEARKNICNKVADSELVPKGRRTSSDSALEAGVETEHSSSKNSTVNSTESKVKSKPSLMGLSKESLENSTKKKAKEGKSASFEANKSQERTKSFEKSLKKFEASSKNVLDSKNGKTSETKNVSSDSTAGLQTKSSFKDKQKQLMEKSKLRAAKLKEKQKEKEKAEEKKRKKRKYASELKKLGIDLSDPPVFHSMYDKVKQRSCQKSVCPPEATSTKKSKNDKKSSKHDDSSDSSDSDSSSSSSGESEKSPPAKKNVRKRVIDSSSSSSESSSSDGKCAKAKGKHTATHGSSDTRKSKLTRMVASDSESEDDRQVKSVKVKKGKKKSKQQSKSTTYSSDESSSDSVDDTSRSKPATKRAKLKSKTSCSSDEQEVKEKSKCKAGLDMSKVKKQQMLMKEKMMKKSLEKSGSSKNLLSQSSKGKSPEVRDTKTGKSSSFSSLSMLKRLKEKKVPKGDKKEKEAAKDRDYLQNRTKSESEGRSHLEGKSSTSKTSKKMKLSDFKKERVELKKEKGVMEKRISFSSREKNISLSSSSSSEKQNSSDNEIRSDFSDSERLFRRLEKVMQSDSDETENNGGKVKPSKHSHSKSSGVISQTEWERSSSSHRHQIDDSTPEKSLSLSAHCNTGFKSPKKTTHSPEVHSDKETPSSSKMREEVIERRERKRSPSPILERRKTISSSSSSSELYQRRLSPTPVVSSTSDIIIPPSKLDFHDDSSSSSEDKLDEDLSKEARLSAERAEHLAESDASNDDLIIPDPPAVSSHGNKEEKQNRRFEEEAAIESQRLEKMMYEIPFNFNHEDDDQDPSESDANSIFSNDVKQSEQIKEQSFDDGSSFGDLEPRVVGGKEVEVDQRLIEEASAVTALLQEMEYPPETSATETESAIDNIPYVAIEAEDEEPSSLQIAEESEGDMPVQPEKIISPARRFSQEGLTASVEPGLESGLVVKDEHIQQPNKSLSPASGPESLQSGLLDVASSRRVSESSIGNEQQQQLLKEEEHEQVPGSKNSLGVLPESSGVASPVKPVDETSQFHCHHPTNKQLDSDVSEDVDCIVRDEVKGDEQKEQERPKRGRRSKAQKLAESSVQLPSNEGNSLGSSEATPSQAATTPSKRLGGKALVPVEKVRRSPRVAGLVELESGQHESLEESGDDSVVGTSGAEGQVEDGHVRGKRGRKKKISGDVSKIDTTTDLKIQKERLVVSIPVSTATSEKVVNTERKYDVFEFRDSDDEMPPPLPLEVIHTKPGEHSKCVEEKKPAEDVPVKGEIELPGAMEGSTETVHPKISMIIRLSDANSGTAEVVKTSKSVNPDPSKPITMSPTATPTVVPSTPVAPATSMVSVVPGSVSQADEAAAEQAKATRKSARLMSQHKSTVDEVIEDVIKGMNKEGPEGFNARYRRLSRLARRSEDSLADFEEELLEDPDSRDGKTESVKTSRVTRSSTRGSTGSEESESHSVTEEASQVIQRRHSHPTPSRISEDIQRNSLEEELVEGSSSKKELDLKESINEESEDTSVIQEPASASTTAEISNASQETVIAQSTEQTQVVISPVVTTSAPASTVTDTEGLVQKEISHPSATSVTSVIQEPIRSVVIPSISERIHNSTTALKLKTGKGFVLDETSSEYYRGPSELIGKPSDITATTTAVTISTGIITSRNAESGCEKLFTSSSIPSETAKAVVHLPPAHTKITIEPKQSSIPASVVTAASQPGHLDKSKIVVSQADNFLRAPTSSEIAEILNNPSYSQQDKQYLLGRYQTLDRIGSPVILPAPTASSPAAGSVGNVAQLPPQSLSGGLHPRPSIMAPGSSHLQASSSLHPEAPFGFQQMMYGTHPFALHPNSPHEVQVRAMQLHQGFSSLNPTDAVRKDKEDKNWKQVDKGLIEYRGAIEEDQRRHQDSMPPPPVIAGLRMPLPGYPGAMGPRHPALVSPNDRFTDSPAVIHSYQASRGLPPAAVLGMSSRLEVQDAPIHVSPATKSDDRRAQQHQVHPYGSHVQPLSDPSQSHTRSHVLPPLGSPAGGYLDIRPAHQPALSPGSHSYPRSNIPSSMQSMDNARKPGSRTNFGSHKDVNVPLSLNLNSPHGQGFHLNPSQLSEHREEGLLRRAYPSPHSVSHVQSDGSLPPLGPPPAHVPAPISQPMMAPQSFPQAQVPSGGDSFLLQRYPVLWQGLLALKNDQAAVQMHFISGSKEIAQASLPPIIPEEGVASPVRISQRMRLEPTHMEGVARKMQSIAEHCILLALPCGRDHMDVLQQSNNLKNGFINYLQSKQAAGIVNSSAPGTQTHAYVIHIFPSSDFSSGHMARIAPDLLHTISDIAHLMIVIATV